MQLNLSPDQLAQLSTLLTPETKEIFLSNLYSDIESIISELERSKYKYYSDDEDKITNIIAVWLRAKGYDAREQNQSNGAVDLTVYDTKRKFCWLAEAKRGYSHNSVFEGLLQLVTRYVTTDDKEAGLLIYCQSSNAVNFFSGWHTYLYAGNYSKYKGVQNLLDECNKLFKQNQKDGIPIFSGGRNFDIVCRKKSGEEIKIKNFFADLHFSPIDKSARANASLDKNKAKVDLMKHCNEWKYDSVCPSDINVFFENLEKTHPELFE